MKRVTWLVTLIVLALIAVAPATALSFDNSGGGSWTEYMSFPITTTPSEYAQYKIIINGITWEIYNANLSLEVSGTNDNFWNLVQDDGEDIRVFNQAGKQLYFWIEKFDYQNQTAIIRVNLTAGSTELNIAYGNPSATKSDYEDITKAFDYGESFDVPFYKPAQVAIDTASYDAFGILVKVNETTILHITRMGNDHFSGGKIVLTEYNLTTDTWSDYRTIYDSEWDDRNVGGGKVGNRIVAFIQKYDPSTGTTSPDVGFIYSDDGGKTWSNFTSVKHLFDEPELSETRVYGGIVKVNGIYYQPFYGWNADKTRYAIKLLKSTDGINWEEGAVIYNGTTNIGETWIVHIGGGKLIALSRDNTNKVLKQFVSSDGGQTWSSPMDTNLGGGTDVQMATLEYDEELNLVIAIFCDRSDNYLKMSIADADTVFSDPTAWSTPVNLMSMHLGYPDMIRIDDKNRRYLWVASNDASSTDADVYYGIVSAKWQMYGSWDVNEVVSGEYHVKTDNDAHAGLVSTITFQNNVVVEDRSRLIAREKQQNLLYQDTGNRYATTITYTSAEGWVQKIYVVSGGTGAIPVQDTKTLSLDTYYIARTVLDAGNIIYEIYDNNGNLITRLTTYDTTFTNGKIGLGTYGKSTEPAEFYTDWIIVYKIADPADFGTPVIKLFFQKKFGTKTVYVNVTYLDTNVTERYNPTAYYNLEDKPQINVTSTLTVSNVNTTYGADIEIELVEFVTLDKVVYNGTEVTTTYQGTKTNATTGLNYNVYKFTAYEDGTLEIYGHVGNKAYEATYKLDGEQVDIFNVTAVIGEDFEVILPHKGNITIESFTFTNVTSVTINTKDLGVGAKSLLITIDDPENFTVGQKLGTVNVDWGKLYFNITDLQNKPFTGVTYGIFNERYDTISLDPTKLYAGDNVIDIYFHAVKLKRIEIYLNHSNNGVTLDVSVNATQPKDYRGLTRIVASPSYFEVVNLSAEYPYSVMKLVNASGTVIIDYVSNAPTSVSVEGATSYTYEKPVLEITVSSNVTVTDLYRLSTPLKDRLGNPVNFYVLINGSRVDASAGKASKLLKPSWYEVEVPITVTGFELWKFNDSSNIALVEINASDKTLPTAEYRVPSKIETKEVRIQKTKFPWLPFPFLSESKPAQEETPIVRLEGTLRDFYNAPVANKIVRIEVASPNFTRIFNITTDSSGNFKIDVDMARGVEYKVTYKFAGDDVYVGTSTTKTFTIEQLLPAPPEEMTITELLIFVGIVVGLVAVVAGAIYLAKRTKAKTLARMESEFRFFRRLK